MASSEAWINRSRNYKTHWSCDTLYLSCARSLQLTRPSMELGNWGMTGCVTQYKRLGMRYMAPLIHCKNVWSYNKQILRLEVFLEFDQCQSFLYEESDQAPRRGRTPSVKVTSSMSESFVAFIFTWAVNQDQLVNGSFKKTSFSRPGDEEEDLPNKSVFTGIDFRYSGKWPLVPRTGFTTNEDNIANLTVGANVIPFLTYLL